MNGLICADNDEIKIITEEVVEAKCGQAVASDGTRASFPCGEGYYTTVG